MSEKGRIAIADEPPWRVSDFLLRWETILFVLLAVVFLGDTLLSPYFLDIDNLSDATLNFSEKAIIALGMALLILVREIDLSVAAIIAVCSLVMGLASQAGAGPIPLVLTGLIVGAACGCFNGFLVARIGLPSIVVTIGTMSLFRGIAQVVLGDQAISEYPPGFQALGQDYFIKWPPLHYSFSLFVILAIVFALTLHRTALGRKLYAIGANPVAARFSGIPVDRIKFGLFVLTGFLSGIASVLLTARVGSTRPNIALGWELEVVTMVILGGVSIAGGSGTIPGVVIAVFVLGLVTFGLSLINVPGIVISVILGFLLIASITLPILVRRIMTLPRSGRGAPIRSEKRHG
jgi:rhamnose transport system permease protein